MGALGILGGVAKGYVEAADADRERQFNESEAQRRNQLGLVGMLLQNPNVPPEYKGALAQHGLEVVQTPYGKKLPSFDKVMQSLPAPRTPNTNAVPAQPGANVSGPISLAPPAAPPDSIGAGAAPMAL